MTTSATAYPDLIGTWSFDAVLDGELLVVRDGEVAPFNDLQQRLNRKGVGRKQMEQFPAHMRLYDVLLIAGEDLRQLAFTERRARLEAWFARVRPRHSDLSELVQARDKAELERIWAGTRATGIEGLMLKRRDSPYVAGRPMGVSSVRSGFRRGGEVDAAQVGRWPCASRASTESGGTSPPPRPIAWKPCSP